MQMSKEDESAMISLPGVVSPTVIEPPPLPQSRKRGASPADEEQPSACGQFHIEFSVFRIVSVILVAVAAIILILVGFNGDGISLSSFSPADKSVAERKKLLDSYNSLSGNLMSIVIKFVDMALQLTAAVSLLCYAADWTIRRDASNIFTSMAASLLAAAFSFLVCNGPTALNVQLMPGAFFTRILSTDLSSRGSSTQTENVTNLAWDSAYAENTSNNSVLNTIVRSHLVPVEAVTTICVKRWIIPVDPPRVSFDYSSADWMVEALPSTLVPDTTSALLPADTAKTATSIDELSVDLVSARTLYMTALEQLYERFKGYWGIREEDLDVYQGGFFPLFLHDAYYATYETWTGESADVRPWESDGLRVGNVMDFAGDDFVNASRFMLQQLLAKASGIDATGVTAEYQHFPIADTLVYTALTMTIPVEPVSAEYETLDFSYEYRCTLEGCVMNNEAAMVFGPTTAAIMPGVRASALCNNAWPVASMTFDKRDCALVLVSIGKKITGDTLQESGVSGNAIVTGLRTIFTLTVGMLNWTIEDLGTTFNANCGINITEAGDGGCKGVRVVTPALKEEEKVLLLGVGELYMGELFDLRDLLFAYDYTVEGYIKTFVWKRLVSFESAPAIVLPRNFAVVGDTVASLFHGKSDANGVQCPLHVDHLIRNALANHLFAEESLQMSFTVGLHYLFKNGVLHTTSRQGGLRVVDFLGNYQTLRLQISIPRTNVIISFVGCGLLTGFAIWITSTHRRAKRIIEAEAATNVTFVAEVMLNSDKYPRSMLRLSLDQPTPGGGTPRRTKIDDLEFTSTVFGGKPARPNWPSKLSKSAKSIRGLFPVSSSTKSASSILPKPTSKPE